MNEQQQPAPEQPGTWGAPQPPRTKWSARRKAGTAAAVLAIAGGGVGAVYAGAGAAAADSQDGRGAPGGMVRELGGPGGPGMMPEALHGDFVVADEGGGYATQRMQTGTVTAISDTSVTAASADGYTQTYAIDADTAVAGEKPGIGETVTVLAEVEGQTATAIRLAEGNPADRVQRPDGGDRPAPPDGARPPAPGGN